jgi:hypothetical protein
LEILTDIYGYPDEHVAIHLNHRLFFTTDEKSTVQLQLGRLSACLYVVTQMSRNEIINLLMYINYITLETIIILFLRNVSLSHDLHICPQSDPPIEKWQTFPLRRRFTRKQFQTTTNISKGN